MAVRFENCQGEPAPLRSMEASLRSLHLSTRRPSRSCSPLWSPRGKAGQGEPGGIEREARGLVRSSHPRLPSGRRPPPPRQLLPRPAPLCPLPRPGDCPLPRRLAAAAGPRRRATASLVHRRLRLARCVGTRGGIARLDHSRHIRCGSRSGSRPIDRATRLRGRPCAGCAGVQEDRSPCKAVADSASPARLARHRQRWKASR
jgi:hypothetical protein